MAFFESISLTTVTAIILKKSAGMTSLKNLMIVNLISFIRTKKPTERRVLFTNLSPENSRKREGQKPSLFVLPENQVNLIFIPQSSIIEKQWIINQYKMMES